MKNISIFIMALFFAATMHVNAQIETPAPSPLGTVSQRVGLTDISITYSRPGVKGRKIFGGLEAYGKLWRTGANAATKLTVSDEITLGGKKVPAGEYSIFTIPGEDEWTVIINENPRAGTAQYDESLDAARFTIKRTPTPEKVETLTFNFSEVKDDKANLDLEWENTRVRIPLEVKYDETVMAQIDRMMANPEASLANNYYQAANYYFNTNRDSKQALEWVNKAVEINDSRYWVLHLQAKLLEKNGKNSEAKAAAEKSMKLAQEAGNDGFVQMNKELIANLQ